MGDQLVHPVVHAAGAARVVIDGRVIPVIASDVNEAESGGERPVAGQQGQRGQRVGGPTEDLLEPVRDVLGDLHRQPQAGQVGKVPPGDVAEVDVGDLALGQDPQGGGQVQRQAEAAGEVVGGAEREHAQAHVAVGELVRGLAQRAVPAADHDQIRAAVHRGGQGLRQVAGVGDRVLVEQIEPGVVQLPAHRRVVPAAPAGADVDHQRGAAAGADVRGQLRLGPLLPRSGHHHLPPHTCAVVCERGQLRRPHTSSAAGR